MNAVLDISALRDWNFKGTALAVVGFPIHHSLSPEMHNAALRELTERHPAFADWHYFRFAIPPEQIAEALPLFLKAGFRGVNLTIPHKVEVLKYLTLIDSAAAAFGAVNTLVSTSGEYRGFNTDGFGIRKAVQSELNCDLCGADVLLLGAGGAARAVAAECMASGCASLTVFNRSEDRLHELRAQVSGLAKDFRGALSFTPGAVPYGDLPPNLLVINVTALGLREEDPAPCSVADLPQGCKVYDSTYGCVNQLSRDCRARGIAYSDGLSMLVWQGARSFEMWTGHFPNTDTMTHAARTALSFRKSSQL